jgi:hypothetical protein
MDARVRQLPEVLMSQVFTTPEVTLPQVVAALMTKGGDNFQKTKILHDWICDNVAYDTNAASSGKTDNQDYASVLKKQMAVCAGYSNLMKEMCDLAGIESIVINGCLKDTAYGYDPSKGVTTNHTWNAVHLDNKWYLVDCTLDAGYLDGKTFVKNYSTAYLFTDSRSFLYSHMPEKTEQQFYAPSLDNNTFAEEAYIPGKFFEYGLRLEKSKPLYTNTASNGVFNFNIIETKGNVILTNHITPGTPDNAWVMTRSIRGIKTTGIGYILGDMSDSSAESQAPAAAANDKATPAAGAAAPDSAAAAQSTAQQPAAADPQSAQSANGQYTCTVNARYSTSVQIQRKVDAKTFETVWLPKVKGLKDNKQINIYEYSLFKGAFVKSADGKSYYYAEDQFDNEKNNTAFKIYKLLNLPTDDSEEVLRFTLTDGSQSEAAPAASAPAAAAPAATK